jgi:tetratricopeptide (TPR) repeat protein
MADPDRGQVAVDEARTIYRDTGDRLGEAEVTGVLGAIRCALGDLAGCRDTFDEAAGLSRGVGARDAAARDLGQAVYMSIYLDDVVGARARLGRLRALDLLVTRKMKMRLGFLLMLDGWVAREAGDLDAAERLLRQSVELEREVTALAEGTFTKESIAFVEADRGELAQAADRLGALATSCDQSGDMLNAAEARAYQADVEVDLGRAADAEALLRQALPTKQSGDRGSLGYVWAVLARALDAQGRDAEARQAVAEALRAAVPLDHKVAAATAALAIVRGDDARARVKALLAEAERAGVPRLVFQARLALARDAHDRRQLDAIAAEARKRGFGRIADQAAKP